MRTQLQMSLMWNAAQLEVSGATVYRWTVSAQNDTGETVYLVPGSGSVDLCVADKKRKRKKKGEKSWIRIFLVKTILLVSRKSDQNSFHTCSHGWLASDVSTDVGATDCSASQQFSGCFHTCGFTWSSVRHSYSHIWMKVNQYSACVKGASVFHVYCKRAKETMVVEETAQSKAPFHFSSLSLPLLVMKTPVGHRGWFHSTNKPKTNQQRCWQNSSDGTVVS